MGCKVTIHDRGVAELVASPGAKRHVEGGAGQVARASSGLARRRTGRLAKSYKSTKAETTPNGVSARAYTDSPVGHIDEWGSASQAPQGTLRRAAQRSGFRLRITPKGGG